ncbi:MAG: galactose mutarotase [Reichenbachiella sp.]
MRNIFFNTLLATCILFILSCQNEKGDEFSISESVFGAMPDGQEAKLFTIISPNGTVIKVTNYGGIITSLLTPDRNGQLGDIVLGYDKLQDYLDASPYFGAIIGRYGNRIAKGEFSLDSQIYSLATNNGANHLHGGLAGYDKVLWEAETFIKKESAGIIFKRTSPDMEEGYPGNLNCKVTYTFDLNNQLTFEYEARTDKPTIVNLTNHSYFNLTGDPLQTILNHELTLPASNFLPVDSTLIPEGQLQAVAGSPFDFTKANVIGDRIDNNNTQLKFGLGYDHCWVYDDQSDKLKFGGNLYEPSTGREISIYTTEPAVQFYSGNFLDGNNVGKTDIAYQFRTGLCLETQHYPNSPNQEQFPSTRLDPEQTYYTKSIYVFGTR